MDQEVAKTLGDLELKLAQLERELTSAGRREAPAEDAGEQLEQADLTIARAGKLIDEAIEQSSAHSQPGPADGLPPAPAPFSPGPLFEKLEPPYPSHNQPPVAQRSQPPSISHSQPPSPPHAPAVATRPPSGPPAPPLQPPAEQRQSIDIADLVRFRDKLARTMDELIAEYSQLLSLQAPGPSQPPDA